MVVCVMWQLLVREYLNLTLVSLLTDSPFSPLTWFYSK
jgi:hypothetical protein